MLSLQLVIVLWGVVVASLFVIAYLWTRNQLTNHTNLNCIGFGVVLGLIAVTSIFENYFLFAFIMAGYASYMLYLKDRGDGSFLAESTMLSLVSGLIIGFSGLVGCIVCSA